MPLRLASLISLLQILTCTTEQDAQTMFLAAGAQSPFSNGTDTRAFPTVSTSSLNSTSYTPTQSSGVEVVTVTVTLPPAFSTSLPPEVRTINPSEAASILSSLSAQSATAFPVATAAASPTQVVEHCQSTAAEASPTTSSVPPIPTTTSSVSADAYYHKSRTARRA